MVKVRLMGLITLEQDLREINIELKESCTLKDFLDTVTDKYVEKLVGRSASYAQRYAYRQLYKTVGILVILNGRRINAYEEDFSKVIVTNSDEVALLVPVSGG